MSYLANTTMDPKSDSRLPEIAAAHGFDLANLDANRRGRIHDLQAIRLFRRAFRPLYYSGQALAGWLLFCLVAYLCSRRLLLVCLWAGIPITLSCLLSFLIALFGGGRRSILLIQDLVAGQASHLDGRIAISREEREGLGVNRFHGETWLDCRYLIHGECFEVSEAACAVMEARRLYRLYYTPKSNLILSVEPLVESQINVRLP